MSTSLYQEWLNTNAHRSYPFREDTPMTPGSALSITLPNYVFVDCVLMIGGDPSVAVYLGQLSFAGHYLSALFVDATGSPVASLAVNLATHKTNDYYLLTGVGNYDDARGKVILGDLTRLHDDLPEGVYTFFQTSPLRVAAELEPGVIRPDVRGVRSLQVASPTLTDRIYGSVQLIAGPNIKLTYLGNNQIRIDALGTAAFNEPIACDTEAYSLPQPVRTINGIAATDVEIVGGTCVNVTTSGNVVTISDTCSQPCCGCPELEFLTQRIELLQTTLKTVQTYSSVLDDRITNVIEALLAAKAGG